MLVDRFSQNAPVKRTLSKLYFLLGMIVGDLGRIVCHTYNIDFFVCYKVVDGPVVFYVLPRNPPLALCVFCLSADLSIWILLPCCCYSEWIRFNFSDMFNSFFSTNCIFICILWTLCFCQSLFRYFFIIPEGCKHATIPLVFSIPTISARR